MGKKSIDDQNWDNWIERRDGTLFGEFAKDYDNSFKRDDLFKPSKSKSGTSKTTPFSHNPSRNPTGKNTSFLPGVDRWIENKISKSIRTTLVVGFTIVGAIIGYGMSDDVGIEPWLSTVLGAFAGLLTLPLIILTIKLLLAGLTIAAVGIVLYLLYRLLSTP